MKLLVGLLWAHVLVEKLSLLLGPCARYVTTEDHQRTQRNFADTTATRKRRAPPVVDRYGPLISCSSSGGLRERFLRKGERIMALLMHPQCACRGARSPSVLRAVLRMPACAAIFLWDFECTDTGTCVHHPRSDPAKYHRYLPPTSPMS